VPLRRAKERGYLNPTTFIRAAIRHEVAGREVEVTSAEQRIAATLERLSRGASLDEPRPSDSFRGPSPVRKRPHFRRL
jgi:hypothetical protein